MKLILKLLGVVLIVGIIGVVVLFTNLDRAVKAAVEELGPRYTGSTVTLDSVSLSPFSGEGSLSGLVVGNPQGFSTANAFSLGDIAVVLDTQSLAGDPIVIDSIRIMAPEITYEPGKRGSNIAVLQQSLQRASGAAAGDGGTTDESAESGRKLIIRDFTVSGGVVHYGSPLLGDRTVDLKLPGLHLQGIGEKSGGATGAEVAAQIVRALNQQVSMAVANSAEVQELSRELEGQLREKEGELKGKLEGLKGLFDRE